MGLPHLELGGASLSDGRQLEPANPIAFPPVQLTPAGGGPRRVADVPLLTCGAVTAGPPRWQETVVLCRPYSPRGVRVRNKIVIADPRFPQLLDYFSLLYVPAPKSIFSHVRKVRPAHYVVIDATGSA